MQVTVEGVVTSRRGDTNLTLQLPVTHRDYAGPDFAAIWIYTGDAAVELQLPDVGDAVAVTGFTNDRFGQRQLNLLTAIVPAAARPAPAPLVVDPADVVAGGRRAEALEASLVEVRDVACTDPAPSPGVGDVAEPGEFEITGGLRVDDFFHLVPAPPVGTPFPRITGILRWSNDLSKIEPRGPDDVEGGQVIPRGEGLVVNEVDYDQVGVDGTEFVEILHAGDRPASLAGVVLELWDGNNAAPYEAFDLGQVAPNLGPGAYLVVGSAAAVDLAPAGALRLVADRDTNLIQNGPDGVRIIANGEVIDSMAYGAEALPGVTEGPANAPRDDGDAGSVSVSRCPDGADGDDNPADFRRVPTTVGRANNCP